ncbi:MAG: hypothetical protein GF364_21295 [Candidatus Lokiarchaeota archaeon]|nr:hypothetical protein [Candidatus Lokiarchaeota archaeon]
MVKLAIKVDWMNMRVECAPNIKVIDINTENDRSTILMEITNEYDEKEYPVFILSKEKVEMEEPFDDDDRFWKGFIAPSGATGASSAPAPQQNVVKPPSMNNAPASTSSASAADEVEKRKLQAQMDSIQKMVNKLDKQFENGQLNQETYLKKKQFLAQKLGSLMGKLEQL